MSKTKKEDVKSSTNKKKKIIIGSIILNFSSAVQCLNFCPLFAILSSPI